MQAMNIGRLPQRSARVPQNIGARSNFKLGYTKTLNAYAHMPCSTIYMVTVKLISSIDS